MPTSDRPSAAVPSAVLDAARHWAGPAVAVTPLTGDISTRSYYRAACRDSSVIIARHPQPFDAATFPFIETTGLFTAAGLPVPRILASRPAEGLLILEDLGDRLLQQEVAHSAGTFAEDTADLYRQAVDGISRLQQHGTPRLTPAVHAGRMALDADLFRFELQHFCEHYLYRLCRIRPTANQRQQLEAACERLCLRLQQEPQVLCHRDYHARNLLIQDGHRLTIIDHQDARLGPDTYDLASLIHDPYVSLPTSLAEELTHRFRAARPQQEQAGVFAERLDAMAAQRLLKAAGTYAAQKVLRDSDVYLPYLPLALQRASAALARHPRHQDLLTALQAMSDRFRPEPAP